MRSFRQKFVAAGGLEAKMPQPQTAAAPAPPKMSRRERRASAMMHRHINEKIKRANELGRPISLRSNAKGQLEVVMGKPKKKVDPNPQPGEVIAEVAGNDMPEFPGVPAFPEPHVHGEGCQHEDIFTKADELVESVVGSDG